MGKTKAAKIPTLAQVKTLTKDELAYWVAKSSAAFFNGEPIKGFSDDLYDHVKERLEEIDPENPALQEVGAVILEDKVKVELPYWMGSMDKIKADAAVLARFAAKYAGPYVVTEKLDGISGLVYWKNGQLNLYTRGDGKVGQDISHMMKYINHIPPASAFAEFDEFAMRCELIMSKAHWDEKLGSNPRNVVAGALGAKTPKPKILRMIDCVAYEWVSPGRFTQSEQLAKLKAMGFKPAHSVALDEIGVERLSDILLQRRDKGEYVIDGIVALQDHVHNRNTSGNPKYGFAFKSLVTQDRAEVVVTEVEWNLSKDLYAKPLVHFNEVNISGVKIKQATGFNAAYIKANAIGPGSHIVVIRAGDVIPHILEVLTPAPGGPSMPSFKYTWNETNVDILVDKSNAEGEVLDEIAIKEIVHFFNKVDVPGVSEGILTKMYGSGLKTIREISVVTEARLLQVDGVKEKSAAKIAGAIRESMSQLTPLKLLVASNAFGRGFGERKFELILSHVPTFLKSQTPSVEELVAIPGIEKKSAEAFLAGLPRFWAFVKANDFERLFVNSAKNSPVAAAAPAPTSTSSKSSPVAAVAKSPPKKNEAVADKAFVFTGFRDKDLETAIAAAGGRVASGVTKKVQFLVIKDADVKSGKLDKAEELGVKVITRAELMAML